MGSALTVLLLFIKPLNLFVLVPDHLFETGVSGDRLIVLSQERFNIGVDLFLPFHLTMYLPFELRVHSRTIPTVRDTH